ncbi:MAG: hypothetical protein Q8S73_02115 [Deltaproteobacteria bacterium]|nr:hypothetical protein [Deltaproteobacteria bacterium]
MRASVDGSFAEFTCHLLECVECSRGACRPLNGGCSNPGPLYLRARNVVRPAALVALGVALLALLALAALRRSAVRVVADETRESVLPYRVADLTDGSPPTQSTRHTALMSAAAGVFLALHVIAWVTVVRGGYLVCHAERTLPVAGASAGR